MSDIDRLFHDSGREVTLKQILQLDETLDQLRRWQLLDFPTLQQLLDFLTRGDVGACVLSDTCHAPPLVVTHRARHVLRVIACCVYVLWTPRGNSLFLRGVLCYGTVAEIFETMLTPPVASVRNHPDLVKAVPAAAEHTEVALRAGFTTADDDGAQDTKAMDGDASDDDDGATARREGKEGVSLTIDTSAPRGDGTGTPMPPTPRLVTPRPGETCVPRGGVWSPQYAFYKHQYVCCRLLCMDPFGGNVVTFMCASTSAYARAWAKFLGTLSAQEELDPIIAQYVCQVLRQFSQRDFEKLCAKFVEPAVVNGLVFHLGQPPFVDFVLDFLQPSLCSVATTFATMFLERATSVLQTAPAEEYEHTLFANICLLLCSIGDSQDARNDSTIRGYLVGRIIKVNSISDALIAAAFAELSRLPTERTNQVRPRAAVQCA